MNCLIIDDQKVFRAILKKMISLDPSLVLIKECTNAIEAHTAIIETQIDLIFLDVEMPQMNGLDLAKIIQGKRPLIIFITSKLEYALDVFDLNVVDFLIKPIEPSRFLKAVERAKNLVKLNSSADPADSETFVFIRDSSIIRKVNVNDILYLEAKNNYINVYLSNIFYSIHSSLKLIENKLPKDLFIRVHRSFIINLSKIDSIEGSTLFINKTIIPISDSYRSSLNNYMKFL